MPNLAVTIIIKFVLLSHKPIRRKHVFSSTRSIKFLAQLKGKYVAIFQYNSYFFRFTIILHLNLHLSFNLLTF